MLCSVGISLLWSRTRCARVKGPVGWGAEGGRARVEVEGPVGERGGCSRVEGPVSAVLQ